MKSSSCCSPLNQSMTMTSVNLFHRLVLMCHGDCDNSCCSSQPMKTLVMGVPIAVPKICLKISLELKDIVVEYLFDNLQQ